jgi:hypothetical protein
MLKRIWKDPVGSKLISALIIALISSITWFNWQNISSFVTQIPSLLMDSTIISNWIIFVIILILTIVIISVILRWRKPVIFKESGPQSTVLPTRSLSPEDDLLNRVESAKEKVILFGSTGKFYVTYKMRTLLEKKSRDVPIRLYLMDPSSKSRKDRSRIEPFEGPKEDSSRFEKEIAGPLRELLSRTDRSPAGSKLPGLSIYYYNFPISYAIEWIDDHCRIRLFGHGKRDTDSPVLSFDKRSEKYEHFTSQIEWMEKIASGRTSYEWKEKKIKIEPFEK